MKAIHRRLTLFSLGCAQIAGSELTRELRP
jgi:hypothetical protein